LNESDRAEGDGRTEISRAQDIMRDFLARWRWQKGAFGKSGAGLSWPQISPMKPWLVWFICLRAAGKKGLGWSIASQRILFLNRSAIIEPLNTGRSLSANCIRCRVVRKRSYNCKYV